MSPSREAIGSGVPGLVYVLHFERPYLFTTTGGHTRKVEHYIGWTRSKRSLAARLAHHRAGTGARLLAAVSAAGIAWKVVALFPGADRHFERWLHNRCDTPKFCPACQHTRRHIRRLAAVLTRAEAANLCPSSTAV